MFSYYKNVPLLYAAADINFKVMMLRKKQKNSHIHCKDLLTEYLENPKYCSNWKLIHQWQAKGRWEGDIKNILKNKNL